MVVAVTRPHGFDSSNLTSYFFYMTFGNLQYELNITCTCRKVVYGLNFNRQVLFHRKCYSYSYRRYQNIGKKALFEVYIIGENMYLKTYGKYILYKKVSGSVV